MAQRAGRQNSIDFFHKIDNAKYLMRRVISVAIGLCLELDTEFTFNITVAIITICILFLVGRVG